MTTIASANPDEKTSHAEPGSWADCYDVPGADLFAKTRAFGALIASRTHTEHQYFRRAMLSASGARVLVEDPATHRPREMIMLGSNSYLGLAADPRVVDASVAAARKYGYGTGAVSLYAGTTDLHIRLEKQIAEFYRCDDAILFPTGYAANVGAVSALLRQRDTVVNDLFNHASIYDGCRLSGARTRTFAHGRMTHLDRVLGDAVGPDHGTLVITDGVFSMDGDVAQLDKIVELARKHGARVMIDEAHALGVVGPTGRGTAERYGLDGKIDITIGTLSKAPGGIGGYATGSQELIDYLRFYARTYFFSTSIPAPVIAGLIEVFNILDAGGDLFGRLWANIRYATARLAEKGFDLGKTDSAIIPIIIRDEAKLQGILADLHETGIFMNYVAFPAVPRRKCRLRMSMMAQHTRADLDYVIDVMVRLGRKYEIIR